MTGAAVLALVLLPLFGGAVAMRIHERRSAFLFGLGITGAELLLALVVAALPELDVPMHFSVTPISALSVALSVGGLNALFIVLAALLAFMAILYAEPSDREDPGLFVAVVCAYLATVQLQLLSDDLLLFWVGGTAEIGLICLLAARWGTGAEKGRAMLRAARSLGLGQILFGAGLLVLAAHHASGPGSLSFRLDELLLTPLPPERQGVVFFLLFYGLCARLPLFPFHAWLPILASQGTVVVGGVFLLGLKIGCYALLRFVIPLAPAAAVAYGGWIVALGAFSLLYGALMALVQQNLRRLIAFAAVSHTGAVVIGLFSLDATGMTGALLLAFSLGVATSGLLFVTGFVYRRKRTSQIARLGGLFDETPLLALTFLVVCLSGIAMPGTLGFDAGHLLVEGAIATRGAAVGALATVGNVAAAGYLLWAYQRVFLAEAAVRSGRTVRDLRWREGLIAGTLTALIFGMGLSSARWMALLEGPIRSLVPAEAVSEGAP